MQMGKFIVLNSIEMECSEHTFLLGNKVKLLRLFFDSFRSFLGVKSRYFRVAGKKSSKGEEDLDPGKKGVVGGGGESKRVAGRKRRLKGEGVDIRLMAE